MWRHGSGGWQRVDVTCVLNQFIGGGSSAATKSPAGGVILRPDASGSLVVETVSTESSSGFGSDDGGSLAGNVAARVSSRAFSRMRRSSSWLCRCVIVELSQSLTAAAGGRHQFFAHEPLASGPIAGRCRVSSHSTDSSVRRRSWSPLVPRPMAGHRTVRLCSPRTRHPRDANSTPCCLASQGQFGPQGYAPGHQPVPHAPRRSARRRSTKHESARRPRRT